MISVFHHAGAAHLLGNLAALIVVAPRVGRALGWLPFAVLFMLAGALANSSAAALLERPVIGASGAVAGVMAAHLVLFPRSQLALLISLWIALQVVFAFIALDFGGMGWVAHLVGAAIGAVAASVFRTARRGAAIA